MAAASDCTLYSHSLACATTAPFAPGSDLALCIDPGSRALQCQWENGTPRSRPPARSTPYARSRAALQLCNLEFPQPRGYRVAPGLRHLAVAIRPSKNHRTALTHRPKARLRHNIISGEKGVESSRLSRDVGLGPCALRPISACLTCGSLYPVHHKCKSALLQLTAALHTSHTLFLHTESGRTRSRQHHTVLQGCT